MLPAADMPGMHCVQAAQRYADVIMLGLCHISSSSSNYQRLCHICGAVTGVYTMGIAAFQNFSEFVLSRDFLSEFFPSTSECLVHSEEQL
jgi:hypothetical protein